MLPPRELVLAVQRDRGGGDLVADRNRQAVDGSERRADQSTATRLVPGMLGALQPDRPGPGPGSGTRRGKTCRASPDDGNVPLSIVRHTRRLNDPDRRPGYAAAPRPPPSGDHAVQELVENLDHLRARPGTV